MDSDNGTVLLVDDERAVLSALRRLLRVVGCNILMAEGGSEALELLEQHEVTLVISDMRMPEMDGAELLAQVAERWPDTERILLTGYTDLEAAIRAINQGRISRYLDKPWDDEELLRVVEKSLKLAAQEKELKQLRSLTEQQNLELLALNQSLEQKVDERTRKWQLANEQLLGSYRNMVKLFSSMIQHRMGDQGKHNQLGHELLQQVAGQVGMTKEDQKDLHYAWLLRNIGKLGFSDSLLNTPFIDLSVEDQRTFSHHPVLGYAALSMVRPLSGAAKIIRQQKEYLDGSGYPDHLDAEKIDLRAQLLCVLNDFHELVEGYYQSRHLSTDEALEYLDGYASERYNDEYVEALKERVAALAGSGVLADSSKATSELIPGMTLRRDLVSKQGVLLLPAGHKLDTVSISRLLELEANLHDHFEIFVESER